MSSLLTIPAEELAALCAERDTLHAELRVRTVERDLLREQLTAFQCKLFAQESAAEVEVAPHKRNKHDCKPLNPALEREVIRHELPEGERFCAHDGSPLVEIGAGISEQIDVIPQQVWVIQHHRIKYASPCCDRGIKVTPVPARIILKGLFTESALAWIVTAKYMDGLPLYRIAALLARFGGDLSRSTLAASVVRIGEAIQPIVNLLQDHLLDSDIVHGDETVVQVLKESGRPAQRKSCL